MLIIRRHNANKHLTIALTFGVGALIVCSSKVLAQSDSVTGSESQSPLQGKVIQQVNNLPPPSLFPSQNLSQTKEFTTTTTPPATIPPYLPPSNSQQSKSQQSKSQQSNWQQSNPQQSYLLNPQFQRRNQLNTPPPLNTSVSNLQSLMQSMSALQGINAVGNMQALPGSGFGLPAIPQGYPYNAMPQTMPQAQRMTAQSGLETLRNLQGMAAMQLGLPAQSLQGNVQQQQTMQALKFFQSAQQDTTATRMTPPAVRPAWLPAHAYTNDYMVAPYHNLDINPWDKSKIPLRRKVIRLSESVTKYWHCEVAQPCLISLEPMSQAAGNFSFASEDPTGPKGWLQDTNQTNSVGYPIYRYWFAQ